MYVRMYVYEYVCIHDFLEPLNFSYWYVWKIAFLHLFQNTETHETKTV